MNTKTTQRQHIIGAIDALPDECLVELASFLDYLRYKSTEQQQDRSSQNFLLSIAGLGTSAEQNISERDEEILASEISE
ncbi:hypothetical protein IQ249_10925 [Lusitaniella coriacea LEGE 07157]|uniref:DUF2281 domain-containing protein n=1 Tax=Lusitaniella coriacea LEGE 07157 TaxID=945747 RepID=A0A8J7DWL4_9CYAN|nr:hypothetical protein [Lusitaniella coriacea]MBE9116412.1 hypothetical protein [Lusitaniella coriacea LEGE 07157]